MTIKFLDTRLLIIFSLIPWLIAVYIRARHWVHILQLAGYKNNEFRRWLTKNSGKAFPPRAVIEWGALTALIWLGVFLLPEDQTLSPLLLAWTAAQAYQAIITRPTEKAKKELVLTARVFRLLAMLKVVICSQSLLLLWIFIAPRSPLASQALRINCAWLFTLLQLHSLLAPISVLLSNRLIFPLEEYIKKSYFREAQQLVARHSQLTVVAITGSYGKTSTKFILHNLLATTFPALMTPESYNTPMGVTKVIREQLKLFHRFFVVEMGARYPGDIKELCRLTPPGMGILTAIGPQHLETFGTLEKVAATKGELLQALPRDGVAVINQDDPQQRRLAQNFSCQILRYGIATGAENDCWAEEISAGPEGTSFIFHSKQGEKTSLQTPLLGEHNVYNILAACCAARHWGVSLADITRALARLKPVPHRLQLLKGEGGVTIIDDAFNSNPAGAAAALKVLHGFRGGRKILITPGMVELGSEEYAQNKELGRQAAQTCDFVILVGPKRTAPIAEGLREGGFTAHKIIVANNLNAARREMGHLVREGDVVLFENDLPDNYNE